MTVWDVFSLCRRYWIVTILGLMATGCALILASGQGGTYNGQVNVIFLAPQSVRGNALSVTTDSLISVAGVVARVAGGPGGKANTASAEVTLVGQGVETGYSIQQPNAGGQYGYVFQQPVLNVQSAGGSLAEAQEQMDLALQSIRRALGNIEDAAGVDSDMRIGVQLSPGEPTFTYVHGSRARAMATIAFIGVVLTLGTVLMLARVPSQRDKPKRRENELITVASDRTIARTP